MSQEPLQNFFSNNPFKKNIILEKISKNRPFEQKVILHHKRNKRKTMLYASKHDFNKDQRQEEQKSNLIENSINQDNKNKNVIFTGKRYLKFDNLLIKKEDLVDKEEKRKLKELKKNEKKEDNNSNAINPFKNVFCNYKNEENKEGKNDINANLWKENPFKINNNEMHETFNNPFKMQEKKEINKYNFFSQNPFLIQNTDENENPFKILDISKQNHFENLNEKKNENTNDEIKKNPFIDSNLFTFSAFNLNNNNNSTLNDAPKEQSIDDEDKNVEEEVKIEKDENKLKDFKEVEYSKSNKFYETEIENLQFLERENGHSKYISKGSGLFSLLQEKDENEKNVGIFVLRESSTKNIKLQGIILDSTTAEKSILKKNGLKFIFIKNILVKYSKYNADKLTEETKMTFLRIRIDAKEIDNFYNKLNAFLNLIKK